MKEPKFALWLVNRRRRKIEKKHKRENFYEKITPTILSGLIVIAVMLLSCLAVLAISVVIAPLLAEFGVFWGLLIFAGVVAFIPTLLLVAFGCFVFYNWIGTKHRELYDWAYDQEEKWEAYLRGEL